MMNGQVMVPQTHTLTKIFLLYKQGNLVVVLEATQSLASALPQANK